MRARSLAASLLLASLTIAPARAAPVNDDFATAAPLAPAAVAIVDLSDASIQDDEPRGCKPPAAPLGVTVWYRVEAPAEVRLLFRLIAEGSEDMAAYTGSEIEDLRLIGCARSSQLTVGVELFARVRPSEPIFLQVFGTSGSRLPLTSVPVIGGDIEGRVTNSAGEPVPNVCVFAGGARSITRIEALTQADGTYIMTVPPDSYIVRFRPCRDQRYIFATYAEEGARETPVNVGAGETRTGIDIVLLRYGAIRGTITDTDDQALSWICINGWADGGAPGDVATRSFDGAFWLKVPPGTYRINFSSCVEGDPQFIGEWYDDQPSFSTAERVAVGEDEDIALRHVTLVPRAS